MPEALELAIMALEVLEVAVTVPEAATMVAEALEAAIMVSEVAVTVPEALEVAVTVPKGGWLFLSASSRR